MPSVVALEPLRDAVLVMAGAIVLLSLALVLERVVMSRQKHRAGQKEVRLTELIYRATQGAPGIVQLGALSRFERGVMRGILLRLAPDLRGEAGEAITEI